MELKVGTQNLITGMYICGLDCPWLDTPFLAPGHLIKDADDIAELKLHCNYVYIDTERGVKAEIHIEAPVAPTQNYLDDFLDQDKRRAVYRDQKPPLDDLPAAETALETAFVEVAQIMDNTGRDENLDVDAIKATVRPLLDSMIGNVEALSWMSSARGMRISRNRQRIIVHLLWFLRGIWDCIGKTGKCWLWACYCWMWVS